MGYIFFKEEEIKYEKEHECCKKNVLNIIKHLLRKKATNTKTQYLHYCLTMIMKSLHTANKYNK